MAEFVGVSRERHANKRWRPVQNYKFVSDQALAPLVGAELMQVVHAMPIAFLKDGEKYQLVAVLSLVPGKNIFVAPDGRWLGGYIPAQFRFYPFQLVRKATEAEVVLGIYEAGHLLDGSVDEGHDFFDAEGNISAALKPVVEVLTKVEASRIATERAVEALARADLIRPWQIKIGEGPGGRNVQGLYRVDEAALNALGDEAFANVRKAGALPIAYAQMLSAGMLGVFERLAKI